MLKYTTYITIYSSNKIKSIGYFNKKLHKVLANFTDRTKKEGQKGIYYTLYYWQPKLSPRQFPSSRRRKVNTRYSNQFPVRNIFKVLPRHR